MNVASMSAERSASFDAAASLLSPAPVTGCAGVWAYQAAHIYDFWEAWEDLTGERQPVPFWAAIWPGASLLARSLLEQPARVAGRRVIDIGCGAGIVAIAAALAGARTVIANDIDPNALAAARANAALSRVTLDTWEGDLSHDGFDFRARDVVVASELFYERQSASPMIRLLLGASERGAAVYVSDGGRPFFPQEQLSLTLLEERSMAVDSTLEGVSRRLTRLYTVNPRSPSATRADGATSAV